jgi:acyl carrier protein
MRLVAYFIPAAGETPALGALRRHLQTHLPDYMNPTRLVAVAAFPLTTNGKLDRAALSRLDDSRPAMDTAYAPPENAVERTIASVFREVLGIDKVGLHDNFFDLGANSLLLVQAQRALRDRLQRDIPVIRLFQHPTVAALAAQLVDQAPGAPASKPLPARDRAARRKAAQLGRTARSPSARSADAALTRQGRGVSDGQAYRAGAPPPAGGGVPPGPDDAEPADAAESAGAATPPLPGAGAPVAGPPPLGD